MLSNDLLATLVCPVCKNKLTACNNEQGLLCYSCNKKYPVHKGIPILLPNEASPHAKLPTLNPLNKQQEKLSC